MSVPEFHERNANEVAFWNGAGGRSWTDRQEMQDAVLAPISEVLFARANPAPSERVVDVGCGCGATTLELARRVRPAGHVLGVDVSVPMLARARERARGDPDVEFALADATVHRFEAGRTDLLFSRFGVMFFAEPARSFANLRTALKPGGRMVFSCWQEPRKNPWLMIPLQEAYRRVPRLPEMGPEDPGPFAFAREDRVRRILGEAGFSSIAIEPVALSLDIAVGRGLDAAVEGSLAIGPASRALEGQAPELKTAVADSLRIALAPLQRGATVPLGAAIWIVGARSG